MSKKRAKKFDTFCKIIRCWLHCFQAPISGVDQVAITVLFKLVVACRSASFVQ